MESLRLLRPPFLLHLRRLRRLRLRLRRLRLRLRRLPLLRPLRPITLVGLVVLALLTRLQARRFNTLVVAVVVARPPVVLVVMVAVVQVPLVAVQELLGLPIMVVGAVVVVALTPLRQVELVARVWWWSALPQPAWLPSLAVRPIQAPALTFGSTPLQDRALSASRLAFRLPVIWLLVVVAAAVVVFRWAVAVVAVALAVCSRIHPSLLLLAPLTQLRWAVAVLEEVQLVGHRVVHRLSISHQR